jgi:hypothetical protein
MTMLQLSLSLFVKLFYKKQHVQCIEFLIDQFVLTSECDINRGEEEEVIR